MHIQDEIRLKNKVLVSANLIPFAVGGKDKKLHGWDLKNVYLRSAFISLAIKSYQHIFILFIILMVQRSMIWLRLSNKVSIQKINLRNEYTCIYIRGTIRLWHKLYCILTSY